MEGMLGVLRFVYLSSFVDFGSAKKYLSSQYCLKYISKMNLFAERFS